MGFSQFSRSKAGYELTLSSLKFRIHRVRVIRIIRERELLELLEN